MAELRGARAWSLRWGRIRNYTLLAAPIVAFCAAFAMAPVTLVAAVLAGLAMGMGAWFAREPLKDAENTAASDGPAGEPSPAGGDGTTAVPAISAEVRASLYHEIVEHLPEALVVYDGAGVRYANRAALVLGGLTRLDEVAGRPLSAFVPAPIRAAVEARMEAFAASGGAGGSVFPVVVERPSGERRDVEAVAARVRFGGHDAFQVTLRDVTERRQAEARAEHLASFPEQTPDPVLEVRHDGSLAYANPAARRSFPDLETLGVRHPLLAGFPAVVRALERGASGTETLVTVGEAMFEVRAFLTPAPGGGAEGAAGPVARNVRFYVRDVTVRESAVHMLRESEEKFARAFRASPAAVVLTRVADGAVIEANEAFAALVSGGVPADLVGRTTLDLGLWPSAAARSAFMDRLEGGPVEPYEATLPTAAGPRRVLVAADRLLLRGVPCVITTVLDIEARKRAEEALQAERDFTRAVLDASGQGVLIADADERFVYVNAAFERMTGRTRAELLGQRAEFVVCEEDHARHAEENVRRRAGETTTYRLCLIRPDGTLRDVVTTGVPRVVGDGMGSVAIVTDHTERLAAEREMQRLKEFYEGILERLPLQLAVVDAEGRYAYVNPAALRDEDRRAWVIGHTSAEYAARYDAPADVLAVRTAREREAVRTCTMIEWHEQIELEGTHHHFLRVVTPLTSDDGTCAYAVVYALDTTEQVRHEAALRATKDFYESVLNELPIKVAVLDADERVTFANPAMLDGHAHPDAFGPDAFTGLPSAEAERRYGVDPAVMARRAEYLAEARRSGQLQQWEEAHVKPDGTTAHLLSAVKPLRDGLGATTSFVGYGVDVTEQRRSEERTAAVKRFYESILERLPVEVCTFSPDGRYTYLNPACVRDDTLRAWLVGRTAVDYAHTRGFDAAPFERRDAWLQSVLRDRRSSHLEEHLDLPGRAPRTMLRVLTPILRADGEVDHLIGFAIDVTERHAYEQGLIAAKEQAEGLARMKSTFLANISHEVRTPLAGIIGFAEVLEEEVGDAHREAATLIRQSGLRLLETLNSVLDLARLEANALELYRERLDVAAEVREAARLFRPAATRKGLALDAAVPPAPTHAFLDGPIFHRVLANLLSNALKFTEDGHVRVEVEAAATDIVVRVRDTGVGIAPGFLPHVFDEFRQESSGLTRSHQGSGLGLAITKRLVELLRGRIEVESTKGEGTTFTVRFPSGE